MNPINRLSNQLARIESREISLVANIRTLSYNLTNRYYARRLGAARGPTRLRGGEAQTILPFTAPLPISYLRSNDTDFYVREKKKR